MLPKTLAAVAVLLLSGTRTFVQASNINVSLQPVAHTFVSVNPDTGGPTAVHGSDTFLVVLGSAFYTTPLVRFDLSAYAGQSVVGNATVQLYHNSGFPNPESVGLYQQFNPWDETTTNWNNLPGNGTLGPQLDLESVAFNGSNAGYVTWDLPGSVVQSWIDSSLTNNGLAFVGQQPNVQRDQAFYSREAGDMLAPLLNFTVTPEPASMMLLGLGGLALLRRRKALD